MKKLLLLTLLLFPAFSFAETVTYHLEDGETIEDVREEYGHDIWIYDNELDPMVLYIELPDTVNMVEEESDMEPEPQILATSTPQISATEADLQQKISQLMQIIALLEQLIKARYGAEN